MDELFPLWFIPVLVFALFGTNIFALQSLVLPALGVGALVCAAWAPVAGFLYERVARDPGDDGRTPMGRWLVGATAAAVFLVPWLVLMLEAVGRSPSMEAIWKGYRVLYWVWATVILLYLPGIAMVRIASWPPVVPTYTVALSLVLCVGLSALACRSRHVVRQTLDADVASSRVMRFDRMVYLQPFLWFYCSLVLVLAVWWATFASYCGQIESSVWFPVLASAIAICCEHAGW